MTRRVLPVIHLLERDQAVKQARLCAEEGADGCFLIDMGGSLVDTRTAVDEIRDHLPDYWLGVNVLGWDVPGALTYTGDWPIQGLWVDHTGIDEQPLSWRVMPAIRNATATRHLLNPVEVFGGVAFKYGRTVPDQHLGTVAAMAALVVDVVTTSGPGTGQPPDEAKLAAMREYLPDSRLAVASGVAPDNAAMILTHADDVLLATGIESSFGYLDRDLLQAVLACR